MIGGESPGRGQRECPPRGPDATIRWSRYFPNDIWLKRSRNAAVAVVLMLMMRSTTCSRVNRDDGEALSSDSEVRPGTGAPAFRMRPPMPPIFGGEKGYRTV